MRGVPGVLLFGPMLWTCYQPDGNDVRLDVHNVFGVKWRDWKMLFKELDTPLGEIHEYQSPKLFNVLSDPQETQNVLFPNLWVPKAALLQLERHVASLRANPPIPTGAKDPYQPPK